MKSIKRLLTDKWKLAALSCTLVAFVAAVFDQRSAVLIATGAAWVFSLLAYFYESRIIVSPHPPRPDEGRDGDIYLQHEA